MFSKRRYHGANDDAVTREEVILQNAGAEQGWLNVAEIRLALPSPIHVSISFIFHYTRRVLCDFLSVANVRGSSPEDRRIIMFSVQDQAPQI